MCPEDKQGMMPLGWNGILTPDYYNECAGNTGYTYGIPNNSWGNQIAYNGKAYVGIWGYLYGIGDFIQVKLLYSLIKDQKYYVEFFISPAERSDNNTSSIGVYFTEKSESNKEQRGGIKFVQIYNPYIENPDSNILSDANKWYKISGIFTAKGNEQYLLIGNSKKSGMAILKKNEEKKDKRKKKYPIADPDFYYYIDCVSLWPIDSLGNKINIYNSTELVSFDSLQSGEAIVLNNIYFETDKSELLPESFPELDKLVSLMKASPQKSIEISGHTDNTGTEETNIQLSTARAKAVVDFLVSKGIASSRLTYKGYGSSIPLADNDSDEGRSKNRRVELKIISE